MLQCLDSYNYSEITENGVMERWSKTEERTDLPKLYCRSSVLRPATLMALFIALCGASSLLVNHPRRPRGSRYERRYTHSHSGWGCLWMRNLRLALNLPCPQTFWHHHSLVKSHSGQRSEARRCCRTFVGAMANRILLGALGRKISPEMLPVQFQRTPCTCPLF